MKLIDGNLVKTAIQFAKENFKLDMDEAKVSETIRALSFSENMKLADAIKTDDAIVFSSYFDINSVEEAYGTINTMQPSASTIKSQNVKQANAARRANNAQQDANRDATAKARTVAGGNKQATGQGAARYDKRQDPDDVQRGQNAQAAQQANQQASVNTQEIERLKQLVYGRR